MNAKEAPRDHSTQHVFPCSCGCNRQRPAQRLVRRTRNNGCSCGGHVVLSSSMGAKNRNEQLRHRYAARQNGNKMKPLATAKGRRHRFANRLASTVVARSRHLGHEGRFRWNDFIAIASTRRASERGHAGNLAPIAMRVAHRRWVAAATD
jgi:hypothetical protein